MALGTNINQTPVWILISDDIRMPDPAQFLAHLPAKSLVLLRAAEHKKLVRLALDIIPLAHKMGHRVLVAGPINLARKLRADGAHLNEARIKRKSINDLAPGQLPRGFIISASAHNAKALRRAGNMGVDFAILGPAFNTLSHPTTNSLGVLGFTLLARQSPVPVVAVGGINKSTARRLSAGGLNIYGFGAIEMFKTKRKGDP